VLDLPGLVQEVVQNFQPQLQAKHQQLTVSLPPVLPVVLGDPGRVLQILTNLLSNAHKFIPMEGKIALSLQVGQEEVRIAVQDNGIGMTPEEQRHLFTKFYRARPFAKEEEGTGMGLALTRALVEMHGGKIEVESAPGEGSTFRFTLPTASESSALSNASALPREKCLRILVVENEPDHTSLLRHMLEQHNDEVLTTYRGDEALRLAEQARPDLIILDIMLPESSGLSVLE
jgi:Histidine kinase-, DNA gyrase B-, and HSP90-like ATPase/Response regulator receiver domain